MVSDGVQAAILDEQAFADGGSAPRWSASGRWLAYVTRVDVQSAERQLWVRRHDAGDPPAGWREPVLASAGQWRELAYGHITPSPTRDQFLLWRTQGGSGAAFAVVTPQEDGTVDVHELQRFTHDDDPFPPERVEGAWAPDGSRVVMIVAQRDMPRRLVVHDVHPSGVASAGTERDLSAPAGMSFDLPRVLGEQLSADGQWISLDVRPDAGGQNGLAAVRLDGEGAGREVPGCALGRPSGEPSCASGGWHPSRSMLIVRRRTVDASEIRVWDPEVGVLVAVPAFEGSWLGHRARMLVRLDRRSTRLGVVDVDAPTPATTFVDGTNQPSFRHASASPDGRWLLLEHSEARGPTWLEIVDLESDPPWARREVVRTPFGQPRFNAEHWSPSGGTTLLLARESVPRGDERGVDRAISVDLSTGKTIPIELRHAATADRSREPVWKWADRVAPDGESIVLARDGHLALWRAGAPFTELVTLPNTSEWATLVWPPTPRP